ncbi:MAG TPA: DUF4446 family protein [Actinomycetota bacterium]|nr:DUF4446 family protein [Actinomycetota bacterium]
MPDLSNDQMTLALAVVSVIALVSFFTTLFLTMRLTKVRRHYALLRGEGEPRDVISIVNNAMKKVAAQERRLDGLAASLEEQAAIGRFAIQRVGLVRYDAFEEMGGQLSFSAAFLDDHGDGVLISSINGRTETRTYAKPVKGLSSSHNLSDEERSAIQAASTGSGRIEASASATR